jgi:hypothetical protein
MAPRITERIASGGCGGFLNPPGHPEHTTHVETDCNRKKENRGIMSLSCAVESDWVAPATKEMAASILLNWGLTKLPLEHPAVQDWICHVLGYFKGCYLPESGSRNCSDLIIDKRDPMAHADSHRGVDFIREFYPDFIPTAEHFAGAYWGTKPKPAPCAA